MFSSKNVGLPAGFPPPPRPSFKVKLVRAAQKALEVARKNNGGYNKAKALAAAAFVEVSELKTKWSLVQTFQQKQEMGWWDDGHQGWHGEILDATCEGKKHYS